METEIFLLVIVVIVFMAGAGFAAYVMIEKLETLGKSLIVLDKSLKTISDQITTEVRPELGAINRNTRWKQDF